MMAEEFEIQRRDRAAILEYAIEEATEKGSQQKQLEIARKLKIRGMSNVQIAEDTGLSPEEIEKL
jgi:predicted transposase/invertase (TIGR01784 family)